MIVIDTSVAMKWLRSSEEHRKYALSFYVNHLEKKEKIIVPGLFYIEAANALATNTILSSKDVGEGIEFLFDADLVEYRVEPEDVKEASLLARKYKTSVYDMLYAIIAKKKNITLVTADDKFVKKVNFPFVKSLAELSSLEE